MRVVQQHVATEVRIAAEDLIGTLAGEHDLEAMIAHHLAQDEFRHAMRIGGQRFAVARWRLRNCRLTAPA